MDDARIATYRFGVLLFLILLFASITYCQEKTPLHSESHQAANSLEWENAHRIMTFRYQSKDDRLIYYIKKLPRKIKLGSFYHDKESDLSRFNKKSKCYLAIFCLEHLWINSLVPVKCKRYGL